MQYHISPLKLSVSNWLTRVFHLHAATRHRERGLKLWWSRFQPGLSAGAVQPTCNFRAVALNLPVCQSAVKCLPGSYVPPTTHDGEPSSRTDAPVSHGTLRSLRIAALPLTI